jgi:hypothetical protein
MKQSAAHLFKRAFEQQADHIVAIFEWIAKADAAGTLEQDFVRAQAAFDSLPQKRVRPRRRREPT